MLALSFLFQVADDCGLLPLALAIAGSMSIVKGQGSDAGAWDQLHKYLENKWNMQKAKGEVGSSLDRVLDASFDALGGRKQKEFLRMAVLAKGALAPIDMLLNLWGIEVSMSLPPEGRSFESLGDRRIITCNCFFHPVSCKRHDLTVLPLYPAGPDGCPR